MLLLVGSSGVNIGSIVRGIGDVVLGEGAMSSAEVFVIDLNFFGVLALLSNDAFAIIHSNSVALSIICLILHGNSQEVKFDLLWSEG